jgi:hypothetical protein
MADRAILRQGAALKADIEKEFGIAPGALLLKQLP